MFNVGDYIKLNKSYKGFVYYDMSIKDLIKLLEEENESRLFLYRKFIEMSEINFLILEKRKYFPNNVSLEKELLIYSVLNNGAIFSLIDLDKKATVEFCFYKV